MQFNMRSSVSTPTSLSTNNDDYELKLCEMATVLSPSSKRLLNSLLIELTNKFEDVDLNSDECVSYNEFLDVIGEFGATLDSTFDDDGYVMIWNKMLMEQNDDTHYGLLYIPFILKYMKPFINKSIKNTVNTMNINYDDILSLTLKLIYDDDMEIDCFSETATITRFESESFTYIMIQKAIRELIKLSRCFPRISKRKRFENTQETDDDDYQELINNFMSVQSYNPSPNIIKMRIKRKRRYNLVSDEDDDDDDDDHLTRNDTHEIDEYEEFDVDEEGLNELYEKRKNKIFDKYIDHQLTMKELMNAYSVALRSVDNDIILRAITVFDCATNQNAPIFMKIDKIRLYLKQRGLTENELDLAYKCSSAAYHKVTALRLTNMGSISVDHKEEQSISKINNYTNIILPSPDNSSHLTSPFMKNTIRRNSHLVLNELFYPRDNHKQSTKASNAVIGVETKDKRIASSKYKKKICYSKLLLICIALIFLFISTQFAMAQLLTSKLYITKCNGSLDHDIKCRKNNNDNILLVDSVDWNYWFESDHMYYEYVSFLSNDWMHYLFFGCFVLVCLYWIYFIINVLLDFQCTMLRVIGFCYCLFCCCCRLLCGTRSNDEKEDTARNKSSAGICSDKIWNPIFRNAYFATTHWFVIMVLTQIVLISTQTVRLLYFGASNLVVFGDKNKYTSKKPLFIFIFTLFIGVMCIINGSLYLLVIFNYIHINDKTSIIWRERGFISMLIFDIMMDLIFVLSPYLLSINDYQKMDEFYIQNIASLHFQGFIDFIPTMIPMLFLLWHIFDIIKLLEQSFAFNIFSTNYEIEHAEHLETNQTASNTLFMDNDSMRRRPSSNRPQRRTTLTKLSEKEPLDTNDITIDNTYNYNINNNEDNLVNAFYEPSPSISGIQSRTDMNVPTLNIDDKSEAIMAWFDDDSKNDANDEHGMMDNSGLILPKHYKTSKKMIRNKHKKTRRLFVCCGVTAVLCILYGMFIIIVISLKLIINTKLCSNPSIEQIQKQPNLIVWDKCEYPLYPLYFCGSTDCIPCECIKFKWRVSDIDYAELTSNNEHITPQNVLESVLNDFKMLEIVYIEWYLPISQQNISLNIAEFPHSLKALYLFNVNIGHNILNTHLLEVLNVKYSKWNFDSIDESLMGSPYLKILGLQNINLYRIPLSICSLSHLFALDLSATFISQIPSCLTSFDAPLRSLNVLFNALSGSLRKELLNRNDMELMIAPTQLIDGIDDDLYTWFNIGLLYLQYNPMCFNNDNMYCDDSVMCSMHCMDIMQADNVCDPFCNVEQCNYDGFDCDDHNECRSAMLWFQTIDVNSNGVIESNEMNQTAVSLIFINTNITQYLYPMSFTSFIHDIWINPVNCENIN